MRLQVWVSPPNRKFDILVISETLAEWGKYNAKHIECCKTPNVFPYNKSYYPKYKKWLKENGYVKVGYL